MLSRIAITTSGMGFYEITNPVREFLAERGDGLLTLFVRHTSCSLLIQENADPDVRRDLAMFFARLVPPADRPEMDWVRHRDEGPDDMPAHIKAVMMPVSLGLPVAGGRPLLGTWQGIYLVEHRSAPHRREVALHFSADPVADPALQGAV